MLSLLFSLLLFAYLANSQYRFNCDKNFCIKKGNECPTLNCEDGRIVKNATTCGCCPVCIKNLKEDEECTTKYYGWSDKIAECGDGLICEESGRSKGKCVPTACLKKVSSYEEEHKNNKYLLNPSFGCDHFGNYKPVVCIDDVLCFCVDKNGTRIFGTDFPANNDSMKCDCSRDIDDFPREVDAENLPRCLPNGNYDPLQCTRNNCFCMESTVYLDDDEVVNNTPSALKKLSCYDSDRHKDGRTTKCLREREQQMKLFRRENLTVIGVDRIQCELDGTYPPLQCKNGQCFCASRDGEMHKGYENVNKEGGQMICRCLRDKEIVRSNKSRKTSLMKEFDKITCDEKYTSDTNITSQSFFRDFLKKSIR